MLKKINCQDLQGVICKLDKINFPPFPIFINGNSHAGETLIEVPKTKHKSA